MKNEEMVQYFVVNKDLLSSYEVSIGKLMGQLLHAQTIIIEKAIAENDPAYRMWKNQSQTKILLTAKEKQLQKLIEKGFHPIYDEGRTEIPPQSLTVVALPPMSKEKAKPYIKRFQLLKTQKVTLIEKRNDKVLENIEIQLSKPIRPAKNGFKLIDGEDSKV